MREVHYLAEAHLFTKGHYKVIGHQYDLDMLEKFTAMMLLLSVEPDGKEEYLLDDKKRKLIEGEKEEIVKHGHLWTQHVEHLRLYPTIQGRKIEDIIELAMSRLTNGEILQEKPKKGKRGKVPVGPPVFVFFRLAGSYITDSAQMLSIQAAAELSARENLLVRITGSADSATGSADKNAALATARAEHVVKLFKETGVPEERIEIRSEGGITTYEPVLANRNCRIELFVH